MKAILRKTDFGFVFWCPACKCGHGVWLEYQNEITGSIWVWNGNKILPTFTPSILNKKSGCHLTVTNGIIDFCHDHPNKEYAGKSMLLQEF